MYIFALVLLLVKDFYVSPTEVYEGVWTLFAIHRFRGDWKPHRTKSVRFGLRLSTHPSDRCVCQRDSGCSIDRLTPDPNFPPDY